MKRNHKCRLVCYCIEKGLITASQVSHISNANQYFVELENEGIIKSEWGFLGEAKVKFRSIADEKMANDFVAMHTKKDRQILAQK